MLADSDRLLGTVEQVLQASRTREKQQLMNLGEVNLTRLLKETIGMVQTRYNMGENAIRFSSPTDDITILGDKDDLQTAFANLLDNAVKYSGAEPKVSVRLKAAARNKAEVFIKDSGPGIPRSDLKRIFKRFYRVPDLTSAAKGSGLGLAIVRSIIERHRGRVGAESKGEGTGSTFFVRLPRV
jgi:signal transduction histidine kinase